MLILTPFIFTPVTLHHTHICLLDRFFFVLSRRMCECRTTKPRRVKIRFPVFPHVNNVARELC